MILRYLLLIIFTMPYLSYAGDPGWFVNITKDYNGSKIYGVGYIVQIGKQYFVRTASHVTLGSCEVQLVTGHNEELKIIKNTCIIDNAHDDQLIGIKPPEKSTSIGFYSPSIKNFVVWPKLAQTVKKVPRKKYIELGPEAAFYISPKRISKSSKSIEFQQKSESFQFGYNPSFKFSNYVRPVKGRRSLTADIKILPGESGSPVIKDMLVGYNITDVEGKNYSYKLPHMSGGATVILGHTQSYQRYIDRSNFSSPFQGEYIYNAYSKNQIFPKITWDLLGSVFYRKYSTDNGIIQEVQTLAGSSGNATGGNGGNATGGNGGNATGGNGAYIDESKSSQLKMGMIYNGKSVIAFKVNFQKLNKKEKYILYADWENYQYLEDIKKDKDFEVTPIEFNADNLENLIREKAESSNTSYMGSKNCVVSSHKLSDKKLSIYINNFTSIELNLNNLIGPITEITHKDSGKKYIVDIRGLFSVDAMAFSDYTRDSEFKFFNTRSYLMMRTEGSKYIHTQCVIKNLR